MEVLKKLEGGKNEPVTIELADQHVNARWTEAGIPQSARFELLEPTDLPPVPDQMAANDPEIIGALQAAAETAANETSRYALTCLRLRGSTQDLLGALRSQTFGPRHDDANRPGLHSAPRTDEL
jgi:hypothetical protein